MKLYHATTVGGLDILNAYSHDREGNSVLYLTDNPSYSLFYIRDRDIDFVTCGVREDGIVHYDEKFPNQLETIYCGMSGWVYEVDVDAEPTKINGIFVAQGDAEVTHRQYIQDVWKVIQEEMVKGNIQVLYYADLTEEQRALNREGILRLLKSDVRMNDRRRAFFQEYFPEIEP